MSAICAGQPQLLAELPVEDPVGLHASALNGEPSPRRIIAVELAIAGDRDQVEMIGKLDLEIGRNAPAVDRSGQRRLPGRAAVARREIGVILVADIGAGAERIERERAIRRIADEDRAGRPAIGNAIQQIRRGRGRSGHRRAGHRRLADIEQGGRAGLAAVLGDVGDDIERDPVGRLPAQRQAAGDIFLARPRCRAGSPAR